MTVAERLLRNQGLRNLIPPRVKASFAENRVRLVRVARRSELRNVYHCCVHKTGSQWVRKVLADPAVYRVTGLRPYAYAPRLPPERRNRGYHGLRFDEPLPRRTIVSPLYISVEGFRATPKPEPWRAFFVGRDPRDIVVSWYFSALRSHPTASNPGLRRTREQLEAMTEEEGLVFAIRRLAEGGLFDALRGWWTAPPEGVLLVRYEDLIGPEGEEVWGRVLDHCDVALSPAERRELLERYSFRRLAGRPPGQEDPGSKLRKGVAGDWRNRFSPAVRRAFAEATGDLAAALGYGD
ncbi:MAG TPA: sulfotransferase domain-containing protein [Actinomycetota bacterium]|nr:sulfotransferase domain-containing protein [Actinomycetota bacterium]